MTKSKLKNFTENKTFPNFLQPSYSEVINGISLKGKWVKDFFGNENPLILELGCGKGEYTIGLAKKHPNNNYIGLDIKGARMWRGCKTSVEDNMKNVAFIRTQIDLIENFFAHNEVSELWLTFPDPQLKKTKIKKRLTSPYFLSKYKNILITEGIIHLKTDNTTFFDYTLEVIKDFNHQLLYYTKDLYNSGITEDVADIKTFYEEMYLKERVSINYLKFRLGAKG
ncbi:MAG: tRNA (guanosine(46)-N7)-methyltransferase TrmB [Bacteroidales bacterium]|nr:tRNA (guanosine(46)-N7)-methyltransferase TrmB [Bacteroidales bacterium]